VQLQFLGATGTVTGSKYLLRHGGAMLLAVLASPAALD
jgi:metallo-beta-lactamase family protein